MDKKKPLGYYNYTVILTYIGMLLGFSGILVVIREDYCKAVLLLIGAGICDMFDGAVASTKKRTVPEKRFGIQIDSLSDLINFGVMPAVFVYMISGQTLIAATFSSLYALAALIRLAYFNVSEEERQERTTERRKYYDGVPVTTIAMLLPLVYVVHSKLNLSGNLGFIIMLIVCGTGFLSPVGIKKPNMAGKIVLIIIGLGELFEVLVMGWHMV